MKYLYMPFVRLGLLLLVLMWVATFGFIGMMLWMPILLICGGNVAEKWLDLVTSKTGGDFLMNSFENRYL